MAQLDGRTVAFVATNNFEDSELTSPWDAVVGAGATVKLIAPETGQIEGKNGHTQQVDLTTADAKPEDFDALVLPGGTGNADQIRMDENAVAFVKAIVEAGKPVAAICHAAWILTEADAVRDLEITSYPSLKTDLTNAGAKWVDEEVVCDRGIVTSRTPDDLPAFNAKLIEEFAEGKHNR